MALKKYIFAGLDFVFDREGNPWFIETNGSPHGMRNFERLFGKNTLSKAVADFMKSHGRQLCAVISSEDKYDENKENGVWVYRRLKELIPDLRLCYSEQNRHRRKMLLDSNGELFRPDCIFRYGQKMSRTFEEKASMINPMVMRYIAMDKMLTAELVRKRLSHARVPMSFIVRNTKHLGKMLKDDPEIFKDGYVLKPNFETLGFGVRVFSSPDDKADIRKPVILQQRIIPNLIDGKYWDLRVFVFDGKVVGGEIRSSKNAVTNVAMGSDTEKAPKDTMKKVSAISEEIVKVIDSEACRISRSPRIFNNLKRRIPVTVKNK